MSAEARLAPYDFGAGPVVGGTLFFPEEFSPLYHTSWLGRFTAPQRLEYNRLQALYFNEQLMFFEDALAQSVVRGALRAGVPQALAVSLRRFSEEEKAHSEMFRRLNRLLAPELYAGSDYRFVLVGPAGRGLLDAAAACPELLPLFVWVMILQEERSLHYSRGIMRQEGGFEPHYAAAHRLHFADEVGHVRFDEELIDLFWRGRPAALRRINARLLCWAMGEYFNAPRRACLRVLDELGRSRPELVGDVAAMRADVRALEGEVAYHRTLYSREIVPKAFALLDTCPELSGLSDVMFGYEPRLGNG